MANEHAPKSPLEEIAELRLAMFENRRKLRSLVLLARKAGASWRQVGEAAGMTTQGAWKQFRDISELPLSDPVFDPLFKTPQVHSD